MDGDHFEDMMPQCPLCQKGENNSTSKNKVLRTVLGVL